MNSFSRNNSTKIEIELLRRRGATIDWVKNIYLLRDASPRISYNQITGLTVWEADPKLWSWQLMLDESPRESTDIYCSYYISEELSKDHGCRTTTLIYLFPDKEKSPFFYVKYHGLRQLMLTHKEVKRKIAGLLQSFYVDKPL
jgi:hypothetical protein